MEAKAKKDRLNLGIEGCFGLQYSDQISNESKVTPIVADNHILFNEKIQVRDMIFLDVLLWDYYGKAVIHRN
ncbi:hypothetical protein SAMN06265367_103274 [Algoriphagus winogradskyi]|uniref:Uncharacterized protein n=1 Tax=Algoriphagus winogradskyi TaxID=237017 RepID=A0ABY1NYK9_9BACT|nr:hypothetical protein SAMN06265367_103274 [Algoriphagus winogradskyi]